MKKNLIIAILAVFALLSLTFTGARAAGFIGHDQLGKGSVWSNTVKDGSLRYRDLNDHTIKRLKGKKGERGARGLTGAAGTDGLAVANTRQFDPTSIENVGGTFGKFGEGVRATLLGSFDLSPGKYMLTANGLFVPSEPTTGQSHGELALRVDTGSSWGLDYGTSFSPVSPTPGRESTSSSTRVVTVSSYTTVLVYAFGYADDQGSADSGKITATAWVTVAKVQ